jgi:hypothetical protein
MDTQISQAFLSAAFFSLKENGDRLTRYSNLDKIDFKSTSRIKVRKKVLSALYQEDTTHPLILFFKSSTF